MMAALSFSSLHIGSSSGKTKTRVESSMKQRSRARMVRELTRPFNSASDHMCYCSSGNSDAPQGGASVQASTGRAADTERR
jgi:hypothetical protein